MNKILLPMLATLVAAGCGGGGGSDDSNNATGNQDSGGTAPVSVDVSVPPSEVPNGTDDLQACVAIDSVSIKDLSGTIVEWTTKSMSDPYGVNSKQCIPADSEIPVDNDGYPKFIVIDLYDITGIDLKDLIAEQLVPVGEYTSMALSVLQGSYGDFLDTPYSYVGNPVDKMKMDIVDDLTFDGLNINIDVPEKFIFTFDLRSLLQLVDQAYILKSEGFRVANEALSGTILGDVDLSSCVNKTDDSYVYLYESDSKYGDLGSAYAPVMTAKVSSDDQYKMEHVPQGNYDVVLVCDALLDLPNQIDLDIDLDGAPNDKGHYIKAGEEHYLHL
ncbi:hypothetical protein C9I98_04190 [Photobacterium sanctipauli]|uniref:Uncharacterized protein n=1 Tax=Photobacterium sanctipauli TaxID=1342794 RepID=A0A2T3NY86_9GAMM|nr:hypothetical protein [Photobacterium sanctipauli]PSW21159.1 hypothetical protein C9I98_04190 [Photobacterium sanctipauli]